MRRYHLSKKKIKEIKNKLALDIWIDGPVEMVEDDFKIVLINGIPSFFEKDGVYYPTVILLLNTNFEKNYVIVDMGAVKHVLNGANIFAAGIVDADRTIGPGDCTIIRDEKYKKPLAVGIAKMSGDEMISSKKGVAVESIHHYGDKIMAQL